MSYRGPQQPPSPEMVAWSEQAKRDYYDVLKRFPPAQSNRGLQTYQASDCRDMLEHDIPELLYRGQYFLKPGKLKERCSKAIDALKDATPEQRAKWEKAVLELTGEVAQWV